MRCKILLKCELDFSRPPQHSLMKMFKWCIDPNRALLNGFTKIEVVLKRTGELADSFLASRFSLNSIPLLSHSKSSKDIILGQLRNKRLERVRSPLTY